MTLKLAWFMVSRERLSVSNQSATEHNFISHCHHYDMKFADFFSDCKYSQNGSLETFKLIELTAHNSDLLKAFGFVLPLKLMTVTVCLTATK